MYSYIYIYLCNLCGIFVTYVFYPYNFSDLGLFLSLEFVLLKFHLSLINLNQRKMTFKVIHIQTG